MEDIEIQISELEKQIVALKSQRKRTITQILKEGSALVHSAITVKGWVTSEKRIGKIIFISLNDGSGPGTLQCILDKTKFQDFSVPQSCAARGSAVQFEGTIVLSSGKGQEIELSVDKVILIGSCDVTKYPLASSHHSFEHLRSIAHLRVRVDPIAAVMRIRSALSFATHEYFTQQGFFYVHTPLITTSDCEGAGEMFQVTAGKPGTEFFSKPAFLTVSGQLNGEMYACGLGKIYTFGPTFRAENSHTSRHLSEFWMIEPEIAFCDLQGDMDYAEGYVKHCLQFALANCSDDLDYLEKGRGEWKPVSPGLKKKLTDVCRHPFARCSYTDAIKLLQDSKIEFMNDKKVVIPVVWGIDLSTPMERWLAETHFGRPVMVFGYPKEIKAFYMKLQDDQKTVASFDMLVPGVGELIGGSQREDRLEILEKKIMETGMSIEPYRAYLDLRKYGSVPHAGFGLGFERLIMFCTGMEHIRDIIPFPRYPGSAEY